MKPKLNKHYKTHQGYFIPRHPEKYIGKCEIIYRSAWESRLMSYCDSHPEIIRWNSEGIVIPYIYSIDGKQHRYFIDFYLEILNQDRTITKKIIEVKPYKETQVPIKPKVNNKKATQRYLTEVSNYIKNQDKWKAATEFAKKHGMEFVILDEYGLGIKKR